MQQELDLNCKCIKVVDPDDPTMLFCPHGRTPMPKKWAKGPMISDIDKDQLFEGVYVIADVGQKESSKGKYLAFKLKDASGTVESRMWDIGPGNLVGRIPENGEPVLIRALMEEYRDKPQIKVSKMKVLAIEELESLEGFVPTSLSDLNDLYTGLFSYVGMIKDLPMRDAMDDLLREVKPQLMKAPAGLKNHHARVGGLMEHVLSMLEIAVFLSDKYKLNRDVMIAACMLHDIGKIHELEVTLQLEFTDQGTLLGHIAIGLLLQDKFFSARGVDKSLDLHVKHCLLSHHGHLEYGSPVAPATLEAMMFHQVDMIDSHYQMYQDLVSTKPVNRFNVTTEYCKPLGGYFWIPKETK